MRSEKEVYDIVLNFAKTDKRIRMVTLEGSRTNTNIPPDDFQDFDITFFVTDMDSFTSDDKWLDIFGERLILQKPEDMELFPAVEKGFSYLMLFTDDVKIDLTLLPLELIDEYFTWDKLVKLLLDKDNRIVKPPIPTDIDYHLQKPTQRMFDDCCNEFWNTTTYVVKGLCRKEILFAIDHMNDIVRKELLRMISWLIGIKQGFHFSLGKNYKFMKQYVPEELWERLMSTYNMDSYPHMWESFEQCMALFREVSSEVACQLDYQYPLYDEKISNYVIRQKKKYGIVIWFLRLPSLPTKRTGKSNRILICGIWKISTANPGYASSWKNISAWSGIRPKSRNPLKSRSSVACFFPIMRAS